MLFLMYMNFKLNISSLLHDFIKTMYYKVINFPLDIALLKSHRF